MTVLIFLFGVFVVVLVFSRENQPHAFSECAACHAAGTGTAEAARRLTAPVALLCTGSCHRTVLTEGYMHPVNVTPRKTPVPVDMPLSLAGELVCSTCHDVHAERLTPFGERTNFLRRGERGKAFCRICHARTAPGGPGHGALLGEAHFRARYDATDATREIDALSRSCISCHDGSFASSPSIMAGSWTHERNLVANDRGSHPIGVDYEACRVKQGRKTDLRPITAVDWRIRFFQGKVGCGSCHDPYSLIPKRLVMSDRESRLCLSCHMI